MAKKEKQEKKDLEWLGHGEHPFLIYGREWAKKQSDEEEDEEKAFQQTLQGVERWNDRWGAWEKYVTGGGAAKLEEFDEDPQRALARLVLAPAQDPRTISNPVLAGIYRFLQSMVGSMVAKPQAMQDFEYRPEVSPGAAKALDFGGQTTGQLLKFITAAQLGGAATGALGNVPQLARLGQLAPEALRAAGRGVATGIAREGLQALGRLEAPTAKEAAGSIAFTAGAGAAGSGVRQILESALPGIHPLIEAPIAGASAGVGGAAAAYPFSGKPVKEYAKETLPQIAAMAILETAMTAGSPATWKPKQEYTRAAHEARMAERRWEEAVKKGDEAVGKAARRDMMEAAEKLWHHAKLAGVDLMRDKKAYTKWLSDQADWKAQQMGGQPEGARQTEPAPALPPPTVEAQAEPSTPGEPPVPAIPTGEPTPPAPPRTPVPVIPEGIVPTTPDVPLDAPTVRAGFPLKINRGKNGQVSVTFPDQSHADLYNIGQAATKSKSFTPAPAFVTKLRDAFGWDEGVDVVSEARRYRDSVRPQIDALERGKAMDASEYSAAQPTPTAPDVAQTPSPVQPAEPPTTKTALELQSLSSPAQPTAAAPSPFAVEWNRDNRLISIRQNDKIVGSMSASTKSAGLQSLSKWFDKQGVDATDVPVAIRFTSGEDEEYRTTSTTVGQMMGEMAAPVVPKDVVPDVPDVEQTVAPIAESAPEPTAPVTPAAKETWEMTREQYREHRKAEALRRYPDADEEGIRMTLENVDQEWRQLLVEAGKEHRIPDEVLDDLVDTVGLEPVLREFRGVSEKAIEGWLPKNVREEEVSWLDVGPIPKKVWERTLAEVRKDAVAETKYKMSPKDYRAIRQEHHDIVEKALREGEQVPFEALKDFPDLMAKSKQPAAPVSPPEYSGEPGIPIRYKPQKHLTGSGRYGLTQDGATTHGGYDTWEEAVDAANRANRKAAKTDRTVKEQEQTEQSKYPALTWGKGEPGYIKLASRNEVGALRANLVGKIAQPYEHDSPVYLDKGRLVRIDNNEHQRNSGKYALHLVNPDDYGEHFQWSKHGEEKAIAARAHGKGTEAPPLVAPAPPPIDEAPSQPPTSPDAPADDLMRSWKTERDQLVAKKYKNRGDEIRIERLTKMLAAKPEKWKLGDGVGHRVTRDQINRGFRIVDVDPLKKEVLIRQVADTGITITGGDHDRIADQWVPIIDLVRDNRYNLRTPAPMSDAPKPANSKAVYEQAIARKGIIDLGNSPDGATAIKAVSLGDGFDVELYFKTPGQTEPGSHRLSLVNDAPHILSTPTTLAGAHDKAVFLASSERTRKELVDKWREKQVPVKVAADVEPTGNTDGAKVDDSSVGPKTKPIEPVDMGWTDTTKEPASADIPEGFDPVTLDQVKISGKSGKVADGTGFTLEQKTHIADTLLKQRAPMTDAPLGKAAEAGINRYAENRGETVKIKVPNDGTLRVVKSVEAIDTVLSKIGVRQDAGDKVRLPQAIDKSYDDIAFLRTPFGPAVTDGVTLLPIDEATYEKVSKGNVGVAGFKGRIRVAGNKEYDAISEFIGPEGHPLYVDRRVGTHDGSSETREAVVFTSGPDTEVYIPAKAFDHLVRQGTVKFRLGGNGVVVATNRTGEITGVVAPHAGKTVDQWFGVEQPKHAKTPSPPSEVQGAPKRPKKQSAIPGNPTKQVEPITRMELLRLMEDTLGTAIRTGHLRRTTTAGEYNVRQGDIRLRAAEDMDTAAHEIGHHITRQAGLASNLPEIQSLGAAIYPNGSRDLQENEGIAEFFRMYFTRPQDAQTNAPTFYADLQNRLGQDPDMKRSLDALQDGYRRLYEQDDFAKSESMICREQPEPSTIFTPKEQYAKKVLDDILGIQKATTLLTEPGAKLPADEDPYNLATLARNSAGKARVMLTESMVNPAGELAGPSLHKRLEPISKNAEKFEHYLIAKRGEWLRTEKGMETGEPEPGFYQRRIADLERERPEFVPASKAIYEYTGQLLDHLVDAGVTSQETADTIKKYSLYYVPFWRAFEPDEMRGADKGVGHGKTYADLSSPIKKMKGSTRSLTPPIENLVKLTHMVVNIADRNQVGRVFAALEEDAEDMGYLISRIKPPVEANPVHLERLERALEDSGIPRGVLDSADLDRIVNVFAPVRFARPMDAKENILTVWVDGERRFYQVHPDLYNAMKNIDPPQANFLVKFLRPFAAMLRVGATITPDFMLARNPARDQMTALMYSETGYTPLDFVKSLASVLKKDDIYKIWLASGGAQSTVMSLNRVGLQTTADEVLGRKHRNLVMRTLKDVWGGLERIGEATEQATRLGEFSRSLHRKTSGFTKEELVRAAMRSLDVTVPFQRAGEVLRSTNPITAFQNPGVQGTDKMLREAKKDPKRFILRGLLYITIPTLINYALTHKDERRKQLPPWRKMLFWNVPVAGRLVPIPKPPGVGMIFGSLVEAFLDYVLEKDPKAIAELAMSATEETIPNIIPTMVVPLLEVFANKSTFTGGRVVPTTELDYLKPGMAHESYGPQTSEFAKTLGDAINVSPRKIEHLIRGYTGGTGQHVLDLVDLLWGGALLSKKTPSEFIPGVKAFTVDPYRNSRSVNEFYDELYKLEAQLRLYNERARTDKRKVEPPDTQRLAFLRAAKKEMDSRQAYIKDTQWNKSISPAERKRRISAAQFELTNIALLTQGKRPIPAEEAGLGFDPAAYATPRGYKRDDAALTVKSATTRTAPPKAPKF